MAEPNEQAFRSFTKELEVVARFRSDQQATSPANQALKLTAHAARLVAARRFKATGKNNRYVRATGYNQPAVFRRSLAPVR